MRYLSLFSGIEAASVAWHPLGWQPVAFAEIEPFPSAVLQHRFPSVPNWGDVSNFKEWPDEPIDLIVGGSPCQAFSVAGLRKGLDDPRGNLSLTYLAIVEKYLPEWIVWENVPGVLSSSGGRDFAAFLGALDALGYGYAWRVLDAQYVRTPDYPRAVPQRRRRVFVVGNRRGWQRAAAVLFDSESVCGNPPPSREKRQGFTSASSEGVGGEGSNGSELALYDEVNLTSPFNRQNRNSQSPSHTLNTEAGRSLLVNSLIYQDVVGTVCADDAKWVQNQTVAQDKLIIEKAKSPYAHAFKIRGGSETETGEQGGTPGKKAGKGYLGSDETAFTVASTQDQHIAVAQQDVAGTLDASYYKGCGAFQGREREIVAVSDVYPINTMAVQGRPSDNGKMTFGIGTPDDPCPTLQKAHSHAVAYETHGVDLYNQELTDDVHCPLRTAGGHGAPAVLNQAMAFDGYNQTVSETAQTIRSDKTDGDHVGMVLQQAMAFEPGSIARNAGPSDLSEVSPTLRREMGDNQPATLSAMAVRRLTPVECERLQGFPDGWTQIPWRKKPVEDCPDGPRYKAIGNSMAVNVMQWIGLRIAMFEELQYILADADSDESISPGDADGLDGRAY